jgi:hypothetical protein
VVDAPAAPEGLEKPVARMRIDSIRLRDVVDVDYDVSRHNTSTKACFERRKTQ